MGIPSPDCELTYDSSTDTVTLKFESQLATSTRPDQSSYDAAQEAFTILHENNPGSSGTLDPMLLVTH